MVVKNIFQRTKKVASKYTLIPVEGLKTRRDYRACSQPV